MCRGPLKLLRLVEIVERPGGKKVLRMGCAPASGLTSAGRADRQLRGCPAVPISGRGRLRLLSRRLPRADAGMPTETIEWRPLTIGCRPADRSRSRHRFPVNGSVGFDNSDRHSRGRGPTRSAFSSR